MLWPTATVEELASRKILHVQDGNHGENRPRPDEFDADGMAFIRAADLHLGRIDFIGCSKINAAAERRVRKGIGAPGDVILSHKGTVGKVAFAGLDCPPFVCSPQTTVWRTLDERVLDRGYLQVFLSSQGFRQQLDARKGETDMAAYVSLTAQRQLIVELPPIETQREIARAVGLLHEKIDSNRILAERARSLARARFLGFVAGSVSWVALSQVAEIVLGGTPDRSRADYWTGGSIPWINSGKVNETSIVEPSAFITKEALEASAAKLMPVGATVLAITGATLGQISRLELECSANQSVVGLWSDDRSLNDWLYFAVERQIPRLVASATGAAQQHVNKRNVENLLVPLVDLESLGKWAALALPLLERAGLAARETLRLSRLRDELLPALMEGRLQAGTLVPQALRA